jgi:hypothetical protein
MPLRRDFRLLEQTRVYHSALSALIFDQLGTALILFRCLTHHSRPAGESQGGPWTAAGMNFIRRCRVRPFSHLDRLLTSECCSPQEQEPFLKIAPTRGWAAFRLRQRDYSLPWATPRTAHLKIHLVALMLLCNRLIFFREHHNIHLWLLIIFVWIAFAPRSHSCQLERVQIAMRQYIDTSRDLKFSKASVVKYVSF